MTEIPVWKSSDYRKIIQEVNECFTFSAEAKREREDLARKAYKAYRVYLDDVKYPFPTKSNIGKFTSDERTRVASALDSLSQNPPLLRYYPRGSTSRKKADWMEAICAYYCEQMPVRDELDDALTQLGIFGTVYAHTRWRIDMRQVGCWQRRATQLPLLDPMTQEPLLDEMGQPQTMTSETMEYVEEERQTYAGPWFNTLHFTEVYPDHLEKYLQDGYFFIHRTMRDRRWLTQRAKEGVYDQKAVNRLLDEDKGRSNPWEDFAPATGQRLESTVKWQQEIGLGALASWVDVEKRKWFEVIEFWCADGYVTTVANGSYILRRRKNPFAHGLFPFVMARNILVPGEHYGMSNWEAAGRLYQAHNDMHNIALTQAHLSAFPPIKISGDVDERQLRQRGLRDTWKIKSPEAVLEFVALPQDGIQVGQAMTNDLSLAIDNLLGTSGALRGAVSDASATSITTAVQQGGLRARYHVEGLGEMIKQIGQHFQEMIRQNQVHDLTVRITGDPQAEPMAIPIDELRDADLVCSPTYSTSQLRMLEEKRMLELYELVVRTQEPNADRRGVFEGVLEVVAPSRKEQFMKSEQQILEEAQAQEAAMQAEEAAKMAKMQDAQEYAAQAGRETAQTESVVRGARAQGRPIMEFAPNRDTAVPPEVDAMGAEFGEMTEVLL